MEIGGFTNDGRIIFEFDQDMLIPESLKNFTLKSEAIEPEELRRNLDNHTEESLVYL